MGAVIYVLARVQETEAAACRALSLQRNGLGNRPGQGHSGGSYDEDSAGMPAVRPQSAASWASSSMLVVPVF